MASAAGPPPVDAAAAQRLIDYATLPNETPLQRMIRIGSQQQTAITIFIRDIEELTKQIDKTSDKYTDHSPCIHINHLSIKYLLKEICVQ